MFKQSGWEKVYIDLLIKTDTTNLKWISRKNFMNSFFVLNCWVHDSTRKGHSNIFDDFKAANDKDISLLTAHFDGCVMGHALR